MGKHRRLLLLTLLLGFSVATVVGCSNKASSSDDSSNDGGGSSSGGTTPTTPTVTTASPLALKMYTIYDEQSYVNNLTFNVTTPTGTLIDPAATTCQPTADNPSIVCTVTVEEGRLFLSSLNFYYTHLPESCSNLIFQPYYYQASTSASYVQPWATAGATGVDCTAGADKACWWGAAPNILSDFPLHVALLSTPDESSLAVPTSTTQTLASAWSLNQGAGIAAGSSTSTDSNGDPVLIVGSNRLAASAGFTTAKQANSYTAADLDSTTETYVANSYVPYSFTCRDHWYDPVSYQILLYVDEQDSQSGTSPTLNHFWSWRDLP